MPRPTRNASPALTRPASSIGAGRSDRPPGSAISPQGLAAMVLVLVVSLLACAGHASAENRGDSGSILFTNGLGEFFVMPADGSGSASLGVAGVDPVWSPDGRKIAFAKKSSPTNFDIYVIDRTGGNERRLTTSPEQDVSPTWSPDGRIAFASTRGAPADSQDRLRLWVMNGDGSDQTRLTDSDVSEDAPSWSPDGRWIAYVRSDAPEVTQPPTGVASDVWLVAADGSGEQRQLTSSAPGSIDHHAAPDWSPDSRHIALHSDRDHAGDWQLYIYDTQSAGPAGSALRRVAASEDMRDTSPSWSPDGTRLVFARSRVSEPAARSTLFVYERADGTVRRLMADSTEAYAPDWTPSDSRR